MTQRKKKAPRPAAPATRAATPPASGSASPEPGRRASPKPPTPELARGAFEVLEVLRTTLIEFAQGARSFAHQARPATAHGEQQPAAPRGAAAALDGALTAAEHGMERAAALAAVQAPPPGGMRIGVQAALFAQLGGVRRALRRASDAALALDGAAYAAGARALSDRIGALVGAWPKSRVAPGGAAWAAGAALVGWGEAPRPALALLEVAHHARQADAARGSDRARTLFLDLLGGAPPHEVRGEAGVWRAQYAHVRRASLPPWACALVSEQAVRQQAWAWAQEGGLDRLAARTRYVALEVLGAEGTLGRWSPCALVARARLALAAQPCVADACAADAAILGDLDLAAVPALVGAVVFIAAQAELSALETEGYAALAACC